MSDTSLIFNVLAKDNASSTFSKVGAAAKVAMAVAAAAVIKFGVDSAQAYAEAETAQLKLTEAFVKFPNIADTNIERLRALNTELMKKTRFDDDATASGQAILAQFNLTGKQLEQLTPLMQDFAAKTGMDLPSAAQALGKAMLGQGRALKQVGIDFKDAGSVGANFDQVMTGLQEKVGGFAEKEGQTAAGQVAILSNQFGELQEKVGGMLVPQLLKLVPILESTIGFFDRNASTIIAVGAAVGGLVIAVKAITFAQKAWTAATMIWSVLQKVVTVGQWLWNVAMLANPIILIVMLVVALVAAFIYLWVTNEGFRQFFIDMWNHIWGFLKGIGHWFANDFVGFFVDGWHLVEKVFSWSNIVAGFKAGINMLIRMWNAIDFGIHIHVPSILGLPGFGLDINDVVPDIPYLAQGGIVTRPTLAMIGEAGPEAVVPLGRGGGMGSHVTFDFRGVEGEFARALRKTVRIQGAGNVQTAFGR